jgi:hypothetical protein
MEVIGDLDQDKIRLRWTEETHGDEKQQVETNILEIFTTRK